MREPRYFRGEPDPRHLGLDLRDLDWWMPLDGPLQEWVDGEWQVVEMKGEH